MICLCLFTLFFFYQKVTSSAKSIQFYSCIPYLMPMANNYPILSEKQYTQMWDNYALNNHINFGSLGTNYTLDIYLLSCFFTLHLSLFDLGISLLLLWWVSILPHVDILWKISYMCKEYKEVVPYGDPMLNIEIMKVSFDEWKITYPLVF